MAKRAGLSVRFHDLWHIYASLMLAAGVHPIVVSEALGHSTVAITLDIIAMSHLARSLHVLKGGQVIIRQPKSANGRRMIALSASTVSVLREHKERQKLERAMLGLALKEDDLVFSTPEGKPLLPNTVTHAWIKLVRRTGIKSIRLHDARHSHASLMLKQGTHPKIVQERLGHASIQITLDTYSHVVPGLQEAAAARFDQFFTAKYNEREKEVAFRNNAKLTPKVDINSPRK